MVDVMLVVQSSTAMASSHDDMTTLMNNIVHQYAFALDGSSQAQPWSPRIGIVTFDSSPTQLHDLSADNTSLLTAIAGRSVPAGQTCTSCALAHAKTQLENHGRASARWEVVLVVGSRQNIFGTDQLAVDTAADVRGEGIAVKVLQFEADVAQVTLEVVRDMASEPPSVFVRGSNETSAAELATLIAADMETSCTQVDYVCRASSTVTCETPVDLIVHGKGFYEMSNGPSELACRICDATATCHEANTVTLIDSNTMRCTMSSHNLAAAYAAVSTDGGDKWTTAQPLTQSAYHACRLRRHRHRHRHRHHRHRHRLRHRRHRRHRHRHHPCHLLPTAAISTTGTPASIASAFSRHPHRHPQRPLLRRHPPCHHRRRHHHRHRRPHRQHHRHHPSLPHHHHLGPRHRRFRLPPTPPPPSSPP